MLLFWGSQGVSRIAGCRGEKLSHFRFSEVQSSSNSEKLRSLVGFSFLPLTFREGNGGEEPGQAQQPRPQHVGKVHKLNGTN